MLLEISAAIGLNYCVVWGLIQTETNSRFLTRIDSPKYYRTKSGKRVRTKNRTLSYGYVQIKLSTARDFDPDLERRHLEDPYNNIYFGALFLKKQIRRCGLNGGIMAYNTGNCRTKNYKHLKRFKKYLNQCLVSRPEDLPHNFLK